MAQVKYCKCVYMVAEPDFAQPAQRTQAMALAMSEEQFTRMMQGIMTIQQGIGGGGSGGGKKSFLDEKGFIRLGNFNNDEKMWK